MGLRESKINKNIEKAEKLLNASERPQYTLPPMDEESIELDVIEQLKANIHMLNELQSRLKFMNQELKSILGARKK